MDNGVFLLFLLLPFGLGFFLAAVALLHGASAGVNALLLGVKNRIVTGHRRRSQRSYIRRHQRDFSL